MLNWETFNIGKGTTLTFDQALGGTNAGQWIAFNFVRDVTARPSQILGSIRTTGLLDTKGNAQVGGQVYVMDANGIIFGGSSR
ncbi:MAG: filamentous hemagglutinin N-terminal domain-containing protein [Lacunisphaera sp.]